MVNSFSSQPQINQHLEAKIVTMMDSIGNEAWELGGEVTDILNYSTLAIYVWLGLVMMWKQGRM